MVHILESSPMRGYQSTNRQLARENCELKQLLNEVIKENAQRREEIHKCHVKIIELEITEKKYSALRHKYNSIVQIIESPAEETLSVTGQSNDQQTVILPLPQASDIEEGETQATTAYGLDAISEHGDEEDLDQDETLKQTTQIEQETTTKPATPSRDAGTYSLHDSLEPADVTSMPSLNQGPPAPEQATLSIWKCLDDTNTPTIEKDKDMFESTPKKPVLANADSRVNMSPLIRDPEQDKRHSIVQTQSDNQQKQQQQTQQDSQQEVEPKEKVKKTKRKIKQKEEDAKRPRTYNLRKRN